MQRPYRAKNSFLYLPRALPWAGMLRPFRAKKIVQLFCVAPLQFLIKVISEKEFTKVLIPPLRGVRGGVRINGTNSKTPP